LQDYFRGLQFLPGKKGRGSLRAGAGVWDSVDAASGARAKQKRTSQK